MLVDIVARGSLADVDDRDSTKVTKGADGLGLSSEVGEDALVAGSSALAANIPGAIESWQTGGRCRCGLVADACPSGRVSREDLVGEVETLVEVPRLVMGAEIGPALTMVTWALVPDKPNSRGRIPGPSLKFGQEPVKI